MRASSQDRKKEGYSMRGCSWSDDMLNIIPQTPYPVLGQHLPASYYLWCALLDTTPAHYPSFPPSQTYPAWFPKTDQFISPYRFGGPYYRPHILPRFITCPYLPGILDGT